VAKKRSRRPPRAALLRRWLGVAAVVIVAYFYYHPLRTYFETRSELATRRTEVQRLAVSSTADALAREARTLGYVRPGEHLFIVKGIQEWLRAHGTLDEGGR